MEKWGIYVWAVFLSLTSKCQPDFMSVSKIRKYKCFIDVLHFQLYKLSVMSCSTEGFNCKHSHISAVGTALSSDLGSEEAKWLPPRHLWSVLNQNVYLVPVFIWPFSKSLIALHEAKAVQSKRRFRLQELPESNSTECSLLSLSHSVIGSIARQAAFGGILFVVQHAFGQQQQHIVWNKN